MGKVRLIVLDILKPHKPSVIDLASVISNIKGIHGVNISVHEIDSKVETIKATIIGESIDFEKVKETVEDMGATIHSIDKVCAGDKLIEEVHTFQDKLA